MTSSSFGAFEGCVLGCAIGDAFGLPYEGISQKRVKRWVRFPLRRRFLFGRGMLSDDTDHNVFVAQALARSQGDVAAFRRCLAWRLHLWLLCFSAGISVGRTGIPPDWVEGVIDWPHSIDYVRARAVGLAAPATKVSTAFSPWLFPRGLFFLFVVLAHGFRRLAPPY